MIMYLRNVVAANLGVTDITDMYVGDTKVIRAELGYEWVFWRNRPEQELHNRFIFSTEWDDNYPGPETPTGLTYSTSSPEADYDWTGVAVAYESLTNGRTRDPLECCTLIGPADETYYAIASDHAYPHTVGRKVYFVGRDNNEFSVTVKATTRMGADFPHLAFPDGAGRLIEFNEKISAEDDKVKIYPIVSNQDINDACTRVCVCVEFNRRLLTYFVIGRTMTARWLQQTYWSEDNRSLQGGDSGKPAFYMQDGVMAVLMGGAIYALASPYAQTFISEINAIMQAAHGDDYVVQEYEITEPRGS